MPAYPKTKTTKKKKKKPGSERKKLIKQLDELTRQICRLRDKDTLCGRCSKPMDDTWQVSHYIGRRHYALRWDLRNVAMQHMGCNLAHNHNPNPYAKWMIKTHGIGVLDELEEILRNHIKTTTPELRELKQELEQILFTYRQQ